MRVRTVEAVDAGRMRRRRAVPERSSAIGARVASFRLAKGWTVRELAAQTGLNETMISRLENGNTPSTPNGYTLAVLATALGVTMDYLWFGYREERAS